MLVHPWDRPVSEAEWRDLLTDVSFGQLIAPGDRDRDVPVVVPTHYVYDGAETLLLHLARPNPVWQALEERPRALLTVIADYVYIPAGVNQGETGVLGRGVPTSYYATVQADCDTVIIDEPAMKAAILNQQLQVFEPPGSARLAVDVEEAADARQLPGIRGLRLTVREVRAKFKYGGNKSAAHRRDIASALENRDEPRDTAARRRLLERLAEPGQSELGQGEPGRPDRGG